MASIDFIDDAGAATLTNGKSGGPARFSSWVPFQMPIGPKAVALGTGIVYRWAHRTDYGARFELRHIPNTNLDVALRLIHHLESGGVITVNTGDFASRSYDNCTLAPDADLSNVLQLSNPAMLEYTLSLAVVNLDGAPMLCVYG